MSCSVPKRARIERTQQNTAAAQNIKSSKHGQQHASCNNSDKDKSSDIYEKVLCQKDYLRLICQFLNITDIFGGIIPVSKYHNIFIASMPQRELIKKCFSYDFGDLWNMFSGDIFKPCVVNDDGDINYYLTCVSISKTMRQLYNDLDYLCQLVPNASDRDKVTNSNQIKINILPLHN